MANLSNVVNVSIVPPGRSLSRTNMNIVAIVTSELGALSSANRTIAIYRPLTSVADDFGTQLKQCMNMQKFCSLKLKTQQTSWWIFSSSLLESFSDESVAATAGVLNRFSS